MRWDLSEFLLKGIYLGLLVLVAIQDPSWTQLAQVGLIAVGTLAFALTVAGVTKLREGYRIRGRLLGFILFLILENPGLVYAGTLLGLTLGLHLVLRDLLDWVEGLVVAGGAVLGLGFYALRHVRRRDVRLWA